MLVIRYDKDDKNTYGSRQILDCISCHLRDVDEIHCDGTFSDDDVVEMCQILLNNPADCNLRSLVLPNNELSVKSAEAIAKLIFVNSSILTLDVRHSLGPEGVDIIVNALVNNNTVLKSLILKGNKLSQKCATSIGIMLQHNDTLEDLHLGHNELGVKGLKVLAPKIRKTLSRLHLSHNHLKARGVQVLASELQGQKHNLEFLDLTCNHIGSKGMHSLGEWLLVRRETNLRHLWLGSNDLCHNCGSIFGSILEYNSTLVEIRLGGNKLGDAGVKALALGLSSNHALQRLELDWNLISDSGGEALAESLLNNGSLKTLDLSGNQIALRGCLALAKALPYHLELRELNMTNNQMNDLASEAFVTSLTEHHCVFETLHWEENSLSNAAIRNLEHAMKYRKNLKRWLTPKYIDQIRDNKVAYLNWMDKNGISDFEVMKLASVLISAHTTECLTVIYLGGVDVGARGIEALSEWIGFEACSVRSLFIRTTSMGDAGARAIADALETNTSLRDLSLTGSHISAVGAASIGRALVQNDTLSRLNLAHNRISVEGLIALARGIQQSMALTSLNVSSNQIVIPQNSELWTELVQTSIRELYLRENGLDDWVMMDFAHSIRDTCPFQSLDLVDNKITERGAWVLSRLLEGYNVKFQY